MTQRKSLVLVAFDKLIKTFPKRLKHKASMLFTMLLMNECVSHMHQVVIDTSLVLNIIKDFDFNFSTRIVSLHCPYNLYSVVKMVSKVLALESPSKSPITEVTHYSVVAYLIANLVLKVAGVLVFAILSLRTF